jgi:orotate phosphoribosyltransferase
MTDEQRERLKAILMSEAVLRGSFTLASGRTSSLYFDCRRASLHPEGAFLAATGLLDRIDELGLRPDCVGGPTLGADPLVGAMVPLSHQRERPLPGFLVRKKPKAHGTGGALEGQWRPGWKAVVVEDTVSTGGSVLEAVRRVEEAGLEVLAVLCLVDRELGGASTLADYRFSALFTAADLGLSEA